MNSTAGAPSTTPDLPPGAENAADGDTRASRWQVRAKWRVLEPGVAHPETTSEDRPSEWAALLHASWLVRSEGRSSVVEIVRIDIRNPDTGLWRAVHDPAVALDAVATVADQRATGHSPGPGEGSGL
jgi:hypothetical protein